MGFTYPTASGSGTITAMTDLIASYEAHMKAAGFAANTVRDRVELLRRVDTELPLGLAQATTEELAEWLARDGWSRQTRATYYGHVKGYFTYHCNPARQLTLDWDPSAGLLRPRVPAGLPRPVTDAELTFAIEHIKAPWHVYVLLAAYGGLRSFEIARLRRGDVTEQTTTIVCGKGGKSRTVPTYPHVWRVVEPLRAGLIARAGDGGQLDADYLSGGAGRQGRRIGLAGFTLHRCRHWYGTMLLRPKELGGAGADLRTVQELMGHSSPATTAIYTLITDEQRRNAVAALPALALASR